MYDSTTKAPANDTTQCGCVLNNGLPGPTSLTQWMLASIAGSAPWLITQTVRQPLCCLMEPDLKLEGTF